MHRPIAVVGAASSIGIRPYDHTAEARHLARAPGVLRELGLATRLQAHDLGDVALPPYRDFVRPPGKARNEESLVQYSHALAERVAAGLEGGRFALVLGGDCSIVLGCLLGASRRAGAIALAYLDAHADFATPEDSDGVRRKYVPGARRRTRHIASRETRRRDGPGAGGGCRLDRATGCD